MNETHKIKKYCCYLQVNYNTLVLSCLSSTIYWIVNLTLYDFLDHCRMGVELARVLLEFSTRRNYWIWDDRFESWLKLQILVEDSTHYCIASSSFQSAPRLIEGGFSLMNFVCVGNTVVALSSYILETTLRLIKRIKHYNQFLFKKKRKMRSIYIIEVVNRGWGLSRSFHFANNFISHESLVQFYTTFLDDENLKLPIIYLY